MKQQTVLTNQSHTANKTPFTATISRSQSNPLLNLQESIGNRTMEGLVKCGLIQTKLRIGRTNDKYEEEADRVADQVMRMSEPGIQRQPT